MKYLIKIISFLLILIIVSDCYLNSAPATPWSPKGLSTAEAHSYLTYESSTTDPDNDDISYQFDWGDGNISEWTDFIESGAVCSANYVWRTTGTYNVNVRARDIDDNMSDWSEVLPVNITTCTNFPPDRPSTPSGIESGFTNILYNFYTSTTDPEGDSISYQFDWGDGTLSYRTNFMESGDTVSANHAWIDTGNYNISVVAIDTRNKISIWSDTLTINIHVNSAPNEPSAPVGPASGFGDSTYAFYASTTDPEGDSISYQFDWGDGTLSYWSVFSNSGNPMSMQHFWSNSGIYSVKVHAKDVYNSESEWSAEHQINITSGGTPPPEDSFPNRIITTINVGDRPQDLDFLPNGEYAYIANRYSSNIYVIRTSDHSVESIIPLGSEPIRVAVLPNGEYVYVTDYYDSCAYVIRTADNAVTDTIKLGGGANEIASLPKGQYLYASSAWTDEISVIRSSDNTIVANIPVGDEPRGFTILPNGEYVYVACMGLDRLDVIRTADNAVVDNIPVAHWPNMLTAHPDGDYVYVNEDFGDEISVIETSTNTWISSITVGPEPKGTAVLPNGKYIYAVSRASNSISVIKKSDHTVVETISVGAYPCYIEASPNGEFLYVTHGKSNILTVIGY